jgi:hypothetical protein
MTGKMQVKKSWQLAEQHGLWWAYEGDLPPPEAFQTHGRPRQYRYLGHTRPAQLRRRCCGGI